MARSGVQAFGFEISTKAQTPNPPEIDTPTTSRTLRNRSKDAALHRRRGDVWLEIVEGGGCWGARSGSETCVCVHGL